MCNFATEIRSVAFAATIVFTKNRKNYGRLSGGQLQTQGPGIATTEAANPLGVMAFSNTTLDSQTMEDQQQ